MRGFLRNTRGFARRASKAARGKTHLLFAFAGAGLLAYGAEAYSHGAGFLVGGFLLVLAAVDARN
jgi:hypothetical protein